ncbi:MAG: methyltransferase domain-containing protein, partial [Pirellulales bacterium]|nr:methyltransferase domain-containing protein [Pirellulales bacterium]
MSQSESRVVRHIQAGEVCCDPKWEEAYRRFESAEQEINKFVRRLRAFGLDKAPQDATVVELFCGRGAGLVALQRLGFSNLCGVDLSETLLRQYRGPATLHLADCRKLPLDDQSFDAVIVQGGLHHLPSLPGDLTDVLLEVKRILKPDGMFYVVEPWLTPFLRLVHAVVKQPLVRKVYAKGDALAAMIDLINNEKEGHILTIEDPI